MGILIRVVVYLSLVIVFAGLLLYVKKRYGHSNLGFLIFLFVYRLPFIFIYYNFIPGDWQDYYREAQYLDDHTLGFGTENIVVLTHPLIKIGMTGIETFFLFSFFGYVGLVLFYLIGHRITQYTDQVKVWGINIFPWILLYPSLHMFTVMLGKDPIVLMAIGLVGYSLTYLQIQKLYLVLGLLILLLIRPHILFVIIASLGIALLWGYEWGRIRKFLLLCFGLILGSMLLPIALQFFRVTEFSLQAIQLAIELNAGYSDDSTTFVDMSGYPFPLKMFTYLFRPLFIDAQNAMLLVYSAENLLFLLLTLSLIRVSFFQWIQRQPRILKFSVIFTFLGTLVLSNGLSVFGLFMRQKTMVFLFLLLIIFAFIHDRNKKGTYRIKPSNTELPPSHA